MASQTSPCPDTNIAAFVPRDGSGRAAFRAVADRPWRVEAAEAAIPRGAVEVTRADLAEVKP